MCRPVGAAKVLDILDECLPWYAGARVGNITQHMMSFTPLLVLLGCYLLGSVPSAVWISRLFAGIDIRTRGSRNAGLTNVFRVLGWKPALPVALMDLSKGIGAVCIGRAFLGWNSSAGFLFGLGCGVVAVIGHSYTVFAGFRGGKGVLTTFGVFVALCAPSALIALLLWFIVLGFTGYVSLASICASLCLGLGNTVVLAWSALTAARGGASAWAQIWNLIWPDAVFFGVTWLVAFFVITKHRPNIRRLLSGTENRFGRKKMNADLQKHAAAQREAQAQAAGLNPHRVAVLGGGSWGSAIARVLTEKGESVALWEHNAEHAAAMNASRECDKLPGIRLPDAMEITADLAAALRDASVVALVVPSHTMRSVCGQIASILSAEEVRARHFVTLTKGIEESTQFRMSEIILESLPGAVPENVSVLSGPSHAEEVGAGLATTVVLANGSEEVAAALQDLFFAPHLRTYRSTDVVGVELCGAVKNVIAIASGILDGLGLGDNARAALMTRGMAEMARLGAKMGGSRESFYGLAGMGDLITTCVSRHSRNRHVGEEIGRGKKLDEVLGSMNMVAEGVRTVSGVMALAGRHGVEMPITAQVHAILFEGQSAPAALELLMNRAAKNERE